MLSYLISLLLIKNSPIKKIVKNTTYYGAVFLIICACKAQKSSSYQVKESIIDLGDGFVMTNDQYLDAIVDFQTDFKNDHLDWMLGDSLSKDEKLAKDLMSEPLPPNGKRFTLESWKGLWSDINKISDSNLRHLVMQRFLNTESSKFDPSTELLTVYRPNLKADESIAFGQIGFEIDQTLLELKQNVEGNIRLAPTTRLIAVLKYRDIQLWLPLFKTQVTSEFNGISRPTTKDWYLRLLFGAIHDEKNRIKVDNKVYMRKDSFERMMVFIRGLPELGERHYMFGLLLETIAELHKAVWTADWLEKHSEASFELWDPENREATLHTIKVDNNYLRLQDARNVNGAFKPVHFQGRSINPLTSSFFARFEKQLLLKIDEFGNVSEVPVAKDPIVK